MEQPEPSNPDKTTSKNAKRRPGNKNLSVREKQMIYNVFNYIYNEELSKVEVELFEKPNKGDVIAKTAKILGVAQATVYRVLRDLRENGEFTAPKRSGPKRNCLEKMDEATLSSLQTKILNCFNLIENPSISKVTKAVNEDPNLPNLSNSTMRKVLLELNFKYSNGKWQFCLNDNGVTEIVIINVRDSDSDCDDSDSSSE